MSNKSKKKFFETRRIIHTHKKRNKSTKMVEGERAGTK